MVAQSREVPAHAGTLDVDIVVDLQILADTADNYTLEENLRAIKLESVLQEIHVTGLPLGLLEDFPVPWNLQFQLIDVCDEASRVVADVVARSILGAFTGRCGQVSTSYPVPGALERASGTE